MAVRPECRRAVAQALGREPTAVEVRDMEAMMLANLRRFARDNRQQAAQMPPAQRMAEAARLTAAELVQAAQKRQQRIALAIEAQARLDSYVAGHPSTGLDALDELVAFKANRKGSVMSLETRGRAIARDAERQLVELWEATGAKWFGLWENDAGLEALTRAIFGEQTTPEANRAAQAWRQVTDSLRERFNGAGGVIGKLDDWGMPHHHSSDKVARAGEDKWIADTIGKLDRARYVNEDGSLMTDAQLGTFLGEAWLSIASRGANKIEPGKFRGTGMKANRHAEERQIHFRDADAFIEYQKTYGERGLYEVMTGHIHRLARDLALVETLGPNPDATFRRALDAAQRAEATADPVNAARIDSRAQSITRLFDYVAGRSDPPANITLSRWADNLKNLLVASRLGSAIISSFSDEATIHLTAAVNGMDATQVLRNELAALNPADRTELRLARRTGLALDTMIGSLNRFGAETVTGVPSKIANAVLRVSGLNAITEARQRAFGITMMDTLGAMTRDMDFAALEASDRQILKSKGITPEDWAIWQRARPEDFGNGNDTVLTPDAVAQVDDARIAEVIGPRLNDIRARADEAIGGLYQRSVQDQARLMKRADKLQAAQQRAATVLEQFTARVRGRTDQATQALRARGDLLKARAERAAVEADINAYLLAEKQQEQIRKFLYAVEDGAFSEGLMPRVERNVQASSRQRGGIGERLGKRLAKSERAIADLEKRIATLDADAATQIQGKDRELADRIDAQVQELGAMVARARERFAQRQEAITRINDRVTEQQARAIRRARTDAMLRLLGTVQEETDMAVIVPGARERVLMGEGLRRGTVKGELVRSIFLFKSFPIAMLMRHWGRASQLGGASRAGYLATLIASTTLLGALSMQVSELLQGRDPKAMSSGKFWLGAMLKGGSLGIYGDFLFSTASQHGQSPTAALLGPSIGMMEEALNLTQGNLIEMAQGGDPQWQAEAIKFFKGITPGTNLWYTRAALDHLIFQRLQEHFSPGYLAKMKKRARKEFDQEYWWEPGKTAPRRAPDFGRAVE